MSTPPQPSAAAWADSFTVSGIAHMPTPGISFAAGTPAATSASSISIRSLRPSEFASLVVPKGASPVQPSASSCRQKAIHFATSGARSGRMGVNTGANTPAKRSTAISNSSLVD
jgi:hypothetical protein